MKREKWIPVKAAPIYAVSSRGRVSRLEKGKRGNSPRGAVMAQHPHQGYMRVSLYMGEGKKYRNFRVDYLVLEAFGEPRPVPSYKAVHINDDDHNNDIENLEWVDRQA